MDLLASAAAGVASDGALALRACVYAARRHDERAAALHVQTMHALQSSSGRPAERTPCSVLWIDDEVEPGDPSVRILTSQGFRVDCAASGATGLRMARGDPYDAIILDLRLPDTSGIALLESIRVSGVSTPVLVLTGYGDLESAVAALRLGVVDFQRKPLIADELVAAVRGVAARRRQADVVSRDEPEPASADDRHSEALRALVARLDEIEATAGDDRATTEELTRALMLAVESPAFDISVFFVCAEGLRHVLTLAETSAGRALVAQVRHWIAPAETNPLINHLRVGMVLARIEAAVSSGAHPSESDLADELGVHPAHLGRLIRSQTGRGFRQWRSVFAIRVAVRRLADREAQIAQIAFGTGYEHPSQLDREFRRLFGVSPREYRRVRQTLLRFTP